MFIFLAFGWFAEGQAAARNGFQGIDLIVKIDSLGAQAEFWVPWGSKWLRGHRFGSEDLQFGSSGGFLGAMGFEIALRASF